MKSFGKNFGRIAPRVAGAVGAFALLAVSPRVASAQIVQNYLGSGGRGGASSPAPSQSPQSLRPGAVFVRPGGPFGMSPGYNQPSYNQPNFSQPNYSPPSFNRLDYNLRNFGPSTYNNAPGYGSGLVYNNAPTYNNAPVFRSERPSGPVVTVPDPYEGRASSAYRPLRPGRFEGAASGGSDLSGYPFGSRSGYSEGGSSDTGYRPIRPVGPAYGSVHPGRSGGTDLRITTPQGTRGVPPAVYQNNYVYNNYHINHSTTIVNAPPLLGGYYYGNYCDSYVSAVTYPSIYSVYAGFPQYIVSPTPNVIIVGQPMPVAYVTTYLPFDTPNYAVTYNQNDYYVASGTQAQDIQGGGAPARAALKNAYPADSYQAAFADIARAWTDGDIAPLRKHIRDTDTRISVLLNTKYSYSIASGDFVQITRDALDRLHTTSFEFTHLRKAKTGDVTAYGAHVYRTDGSQAGTDNGIVPFDQSGTNPDENTTDAAGSAAKTVYVSYTLRHRDGQWYIVEIDSSDHDLVPAQ